MGAELLDLRRELAGRPAVHHFSAFSPLSELLRPPIIRDRAL